MITQQIRKKGDYEEQIQDALQQLSIVEEETNSDTNMELSDRIKSVHSSILRLKSIDSIVSESFASGGVLFLLPQVDQDHLQRQFTMFATRYNDLDTTLVNQVTYLESKQALKEKFVESVKDSETVSGQLSLEERDKKLNDLEVDLSMFKSVLGDEERQCFDEILNKLKNTQNQNDYHIRQPQPIDPTSQDEHTEESVQLTEENFTDEVEKQQQTQDYVNDNNGETANNARLEEALRDNGDSVQEKKEETTHTESGNSEKVQLEETSRDNEMQGIGEVTKPSQQSDHETSLTESDNNFRIQGEKIEETLNDNDNHIKIKVTNPSLQENYQEIMPLGSGNKDGMLRGEVQIEKTLNDNEKQDNIEAASPIQNKTSSEAKPEDVQDIEITSLSVDANEHVSEANKGTKQPMNEVSDSRKPSIIQKIHEDSEPDKPDCKTTHQSLGSQNPSDIPSIHEKLESEKSLDIQAMNEGLKVEKPDGQVKYGGLESNVSVDIQTIQKELESEKPSEIQEILKESTSDKCSDIQKILEESESKKPSDIQKIHAESESEKHSDIQEIYEASESEKSPDIQEMQKEWESEKPSDIQEIHKESESENPIDVQRASKSENVTHPNVQMNVDAPPIINKESLLHKDIPDKEDAENEYPSKNVIVTKEEGVDMEVVRRVGSKSNDTEAPTSSVLEKLRRGDEEERYFSADSLEMLDAKDDNDEEEEEESENSAAEDNKSLKEVKTLVLDTLEKAVNKLNEYEKQEATFDRCTDIRVMINDLDSLEMKETREEISNCQVLLLSLKGVMPESEVADMVEETDNLLACFQDTVEEINRKKFDLNKLSILQNDYEEELSGLSDRLTSFREENNVQTQPISLTGMQRQLTKDKDVLASMQRDLNVIKEQRKTIEEQLPKTIREELLLMESEFQDELSAVAASLMKEESYFNFLKQSKHSLSVTILKYLGSIESITNELNQISNSDDEQSQHLKVKLQREMLKLKEKWHDTVPVIRSTYTILPPEDRSELQGYAEHVMDEFDRVTGTGGKHQDSNMQHIEENYATWQAKFEAIKLSWTERNTESYTHEINKQEQLARKVETIALELGMLDQELDMVSDSDDSLGDLKHRIENSSHEVKSLWSASKENLKLLEENKKVYEEWLDLKQSLDIELENHATIEDDAKQVDDIVAKFSNLENKLDSIKCNLLPFHQNESAKMVESLRKRVQFHKEPNVLEAVSIEEVSEAPPSIVLSPDSSMDISTTMQKKDLQQMNKTYKATLKWLHVNRKTLSHVDQNANNIDDWLSQTITTREEFLEEKEDVLDLVYQMDDLSVLLDEEGANELAKKSEILSKALTEVEIAFGKVIDELNVHIATRDKFIGLLISFEEEVCCFEEGIALSCKQGQVIEGCMISQYSLDEKYQTLSSDLQALVAKIPAAEANEYRVKLDHQKVTLEKLKQRLVDLIVEGKANEDSICNIESSLDTSLNDLDKVNSALSDLLDGKQEPSMLLLTRLECKMVEIAAWVNGYTRQKLNESIEESVKGRLDDFDKCYDETKSLLSEIKKKVGRYEELLTSVKALQSVVRIFKDDLEENAEVSLLNLMKELNELGQGIECADLIEQQRDSLLESIKVMGDDCKNLLENRLSVKANENLDTLKCLEELNEFVLLTKQTLGDIFDDIESERNSMENSHQSMSLLKDALDDVRTNKTRTGEQIQKFYKLCSIIHIDEQLVFWNEIKGDLLKLENEIADKEVKLMERITREQYLVDRCENLENSMNDLMFEHKNVARHFNEWTSKSSLKELISLQNVVNENIARCSKRLRVVQNEAFLFLDEVLKPQRDRISEEMKLLEGKQNDIEHLFAALDEKLQAVDKLLTKIDWIEYERLLKEIQGSTESFNQQQYLRGRLEFLFKKLIKRKNKIVNAVSSGAEVEKRVLTNLPEVQETLKKLDFYEEAFRVFLETPHQLEEGTPEESSSFRSMSESKLESKLADAQIPLKESTSQETIADEKKRETKLESSSNLIEENLQDIQTPALSSAPQAESDKEAKYAIPKECIDHKEYVIDSKNLVEDNQVVSLDGLINDEPATDDSQDSECSSNVSSGDYIINDDNFNNNIGAFALGEELQEEEFQECVDENDGEDNELNRSFGLKWFKNEDRGIFGDLPQTERDGKEMNVSDNGSFKTLSKGRKSFLQLWDCLP